MKQKSWIFKASGSLFLVFLLGLSLLMSFAMAEENALEAVQLPEITEDALPMQQSQNGSAIFGIAVMGKEKDVEISWEGNYTFVQVTGTYKSPKPSLVYAAPGSRDGLQVIEAWKVQNIKKNTALSMTIRLNALPTLAEGESLAFYMLDNGEMANGPLLTDVSAGDLANVQLEFKGTDGVALVRVAADPGDLPVDDQFIWANGDIYLTGKMPGNAVVDATPVTVEVDGEIVLAAYDVRIYTNEKKREKGKTWQPSDKKVQVHFFSDAFRDGQEMNVYHLTDGNSLPEKVATVTAEDSWIAFEAESFSTYAVTVREKIVEASNGETYKITVTYDAASGIPADAQVEAAEISDSSKIYKEYLIRTAQALDVDISSVVYSRLFDISLVGPDGTKYQPDDDVTVSIQLLKDTAEDLAQVRVVHFADEHLDLQPISLNSLSPMQSTNSSQEFSASSELTATAEGTTVSFKTSGFSMFSLIDTHVGNGGEVNAVPANTSDSITLGGPVPTHGILEAISVEAEIDGMASLLAYDMTVYANSTMQNIGIAWQPSSSPVQVTLYSEDLTAEQVDIYHISSEDAQPQLVAEALKVVNGSVTFDASSFSVYVVVETTLTKTVDASDGNTYEINVTYKNSSGIPMEGTELLVAELLPGNEKYDEYLAASAAKVGTKAENIELSRVFDIRIVDENDNSHVYEPVGDVEVSIRLVGETLGDYANLDVLHFVEDKNAEGFTVYDMDSTVDGETVQFTTDSFSVYVVAGYTLEKVITTPDGLTYKITVTFKDDALLPDEAALDVAELSGETYADYVGRAAVAMNAAGFAYARVFDISIVDGEGNRIQPSAPVDVAVELLDAENLEGSFSVVHFAVDVEDPDRNEQPVLVAAEKEANVVTFSTDGFSAYAIVQGPGAVPIGWHTIASIPELIEKGATGLYIGHPDRYYYGNELIYENQANQSGRVGIKKTKPAQSYPADAAAKYYFERVEGQNNQVYVYCCAADGTTKQYVYNDGDNSLSFKDETGKTAFTVTQNPNGTFKLNNGDWYWNMQGGANGSRFCSYDSANDGNNNVNFWYYVDAPQDPYNLNSKSYGLMNWNGTVMGRAMMADSTNTNALDAKSLIVMSTSTNSNQMFVVPNDSDISMWTFTWAEDDKYYLSSGTQYLKINATGLTLVNDQSSASKIQVIPGTGTHAGQISLKAGSTTLTYSGTVENGFSVGGSAGSEWLYLVDLSELTSDYFMTYSASKVSVSDTTSVTNGSKIIVYTRIWNDDTKKYEFYVVDSDGSLVPCYENGDSIQWVGGLLNTKLWNFVEYYWEGTSDPNFYYELYNQYSENFIAPQVSGSQILSGNTIGINLNGRKNGYYYTPIVAWDDGYYAYAGLKADLTTGKIVSCSLSEADDFYFAIVQDLPVDDTLTTVPTVDHTQYGITIKIQDFNATGTASAQNPMSAFLGNDAGGAVSTTVSGLLSTNLGGDGYPTNRSGYSLSSQYSDAREVNHLFIGSTYSGSGYFEYDSTQNFASLNTSTGNFTVYREIATYDGRNTNTLKHGQFLPFNDIEAGVFASVNGKNLYSATAQLLPDSDPRKYEQLYLVKKENLYFAVEIEASFTQPANGLDAWGHDIIYEFTGDDDFWLYVDGELVIDLGGIHSALPGSINFRTGAVNVNGTSTTLKDLFYSNYRGRGYTEAEAQAYVDGIFEENSQGQWVFKDYSTHTMKIFYMERGGGASNLHMRFNLASVRPGHVLLSKELAGVDDRETVMAEFPYQIWYKLEGETEHLLSNHDPLNIQVYYKDTVTPVTFRQSLTVGGISYQNVFILKPGEIADIAIPDEAISYKIVECGVNTDVYNSVTVKEDADLTRAPTSVENRKDYSLNYMATKDRPRVTYVNTVNQGALCNLTIQKVLYREDGVTVITDDDTEFSFRLYLATEYDGDLNDAAAYMQSYHVKDRSSNYCRWDATNQRFVSLGKTDYTALTDAEKVQATFNTSMNGSISKIPGGYTVEIRGVLAGTRYRVEERPWEIPDGYSFQKYEYNNDARVVNRSGVSDVVGTVAASVDPYVNVCNLRGWGLRVNKVWSDASYMTSRDATYFAVYTKDGQGNLTIIPSNAVVKDENGETTTIVRQLPYGKTSVYWYFPTLPVSTATLLENYVIREVTLIGNYSVDAAGNVTLNGATVTPVAAGGSLTLNGRQNGESEAGSYEYTVVYQEGTVASGSQVRVDTVGNNRPGILLKKTDWAGSPLKGATFELKKDGTVLGTFVSDEDGVITTAFLRNDGATYTLTETSSPQGYQAIPTAITLSQTTGTVTVAGPDNAYYTLEQNLGVEASLTIKNRPYTFKAIKKDADTSNPISGAVFSLHKQVTVNGVTSYDLNPLTGYEDLTTGNDGVIPKLDKTLPAGTYQLREKVTPSGYQPLRGHIYFTVSSTGEILLVQHPEASLDSSVDSDTGNIAYTITVTNRSKAKLTLTKQVTGNMGDKSSTNQFEFKLGSVAGEANGTTYAYTKSSTSSGTLTTTSGSNIFTLAHGESIEIELPLNKAVVITETNGNYTTAWSKENNTAATLTNESTASVTVTLSGDATVTVTNTLNAVAPAGVNLRVAPFAVILAVGVFLAAVAIRGSKRKKKDGNKEF